MLTPTILSKGPIYVFNDYEVYVGLGRDKDMLPHYLVMHRVHRVVEYETDTLFAAKQWCAHFGDEKNLEVPASHSSGQMPLELIGEEDAEESNVVPFKPLN